MRRNSSALPWVVAALSVVGCSCSSETNSPTSAAKVGTEEIQQHVMICSPKALEINSILRVQLPAEHGTDLAIVNPDGEYFFLAFSEDARPSNLKPVIPESTYRALSVVNLNVETAVGVPWGKNTVVPEKIFVQPGRYSVFSSKSLETEDPVLDGWCKVDLKSQRLKN